MMPKNRLSRYLVQTLSVLTHLLLSLFLPPHYGDTSHHGVLYSCCLNADGARHIWPDLSCELQKLSSLGSPRSPHLFVDPKSSSSSPDSGPLQVTEDEQADVYCCWAESALLKFR